MAEISISTVWIQMLPGDSQITAREKALMFKDTGVRQFWDPNQLCGKAIAEAFGYKGRVAWDMYLFYEPGSQWYELPPRPAGWMHQISESWADPGRFYTGDDLRRKLYETAQGLLAQKK